MKPIATTREIQAPLELVFQTLSDVRNFRRAVPHIVKIEFATDQQVGAGTRFLETREMNGKEATVELEVAEYVENEHVRMVSDAGGTIWDTVFTVRQTANESVIMQMRMNVRPQTMFARVITPLIRGAVAKAVERDMDAVKAYCEKLVE